MCLWQQTSPESHFTQQRVCTRATPTGRISIRDQRLIFHHGAERTEHALPNQAAVLSALSEHFGIDDL
jgi:N-hydroxyarylamine O-acetyltransferase